MAAKKSIEALPKTTTVIGGLDAIDKTSSDTKQDVSHFMSKLDVDLKNDEVDEDNNEDDDDEIDNEDGDDDDDDDDSNSSDDNDSVITSTAPGSTTSKSDYESYEKLVASAHFGKLGGYFSNFSKPSHGQSRIQCRVCTGFGKTWKSFGNFLSFFFFFFFFF